MAALAFQTVPANRYYIRLDSGVAEGDNDYALLLETVRRQTNSQTAAIYTLETQLSELNAVSISTGVDARVKDIGVTLSSSTTRWIESLVSPVHGRPAAESHFEKFPEALQFQVKRLAVVPLRSQDDLFGLITMGRIEEAPYDAADLEIARRAGRLLTAVLERDTLYRKLSERKLVERAKGILQQRRRLSEEQAYLMLRNNSRRRRLPMADLAREIIELSAPPLAAQHVRTA